MKTHKGVELQLYLLLTFRGRCIYSHKIQQLTFTWSQSYLVYWVDYGLDNWCLIPSLGKIFLFPKPACSGTHHDSHSCTRVLSLEVKEQLFQPGTSRNITCCITPFRIHLSNDIRANWKSLFCDCHLQTLALIVSRAKNDLSTCAVVAELLKSNQQMLILIAVLHFVH